MSVGMDRNETDMLSCKDGEGLRFIG